MEKAEKERSYPAWRKPGAPICSQAQMKGRKRVSGASQAQPKGVTGHLRTIIFMDSDGVRCAATRVPVTVGGSRQNRRGWQMEKEPELVREEERYQLDVVGLTSTGSHRYGTKLDRGWILLWSGPWCEAPGGW